MTHEILVGLEVIDDKKYQQYRDAMKPILNSFGGDFGYDFKIAEVLRAKTTANINRVFTIHFPNNQKMDDFFSDPDYQQVKTQFFNSSVADMTIIASYNK